jgi:hypothetical protein
MRIETPEHSSVDVSSTADKKDLGSDLVAFNSAESSVRQDYSFRMVIITYESSDFKNYCEKERGNAYATTVHFSNFKKIQGQKQSADQHSG